jgi:ketosteroid isomerase-like protein
MHPLNARHWGGSCSQISHYGENVLTSHRVRMIADVTNEGIARKTGLLYHHDYAFFFRIQDGKISRIWECTDTQKGKVAFGT